MKIKTNLRKKENKIGRIKEDSAEILIQKK